MAKPSPAPWCETCQRQRAEECAHVDCSNRKRITAQPVGAVARTEGPSKDGRPLVGSAIVRRPHYFED